MATEMETPPCCCCWSSSCGQSAGWEKLKLNFCPSAKEKASARPRTCSRTSNGERNIYGYECFGNNLHGGSWSESTPLGRKIVSCTTAQAAVRSPGVERRITNQPTTGRGSFFIQPTGKRRPLSHSQVDMGSAANLNYFPGGVFRWF